MRKLLFTLSCITILNANAQVNSDFVVKNEIVQTNQNGRISKIKTSLIDNKSNEETTLTIQNIKKRVSVLEINSSLNDTTTTFTEGGLVDSDAISVKGKDKKRVHKSIQNYVNKPVKIKATLENNFKLSNVENDQNIVAEFISDLPAFNKNAVYTSILLNFSPEKQTYTDTTYSEYPKGVFITNYKKNAIGYDVKGRFEQGDIVFEKSENIVLHNSFEYWNYFGEIVCDNNFITKMTIQNETKYRMVSSKDNGIAMINNYAMVIKNEFK